MGLTIPTAKESFDQNLSNIESKLNQTTPANEKAFNRVLAGIQALDQASLYRFGVERAKQNLVLTATGENLDLIGEEYSVIRKAAESSVLEVQANGSDGTNIPATQNFVGDANGVIYFPDSSNIISSGTSEFNITSEESGIAGNLTVSDTVSLTNPIPGVNTSLSVISIVNTGAEEETDEAYRQRILDVQRNVGGGGNAFDYRRWSEEVAGVKRAYPYSGEPVTGGTSEPPERTVYIEVTTDIDVDGIAPISILNEVRATINNDPITGIARVPLGITDDTLFVESIYLYNVYVRITGLIVDVDKEVSAKESVNNALSSYFTTVRPFISGVDFESDRNDLITSVTLSNIVQDALTEFGASAEDVEFGNTPSTFIEQKRLDEGETPKYQGVSFV